MLSPLPAIAKQIGADERTLRRAVSRGTIHGRRPGARQLDISPSERRYLDAHWDLIARLNRSLRTESNIAFAALYGSMARGDERLDSDVDVLVQFRKERELATMELAMRLEHALDRRVDVTSLDRVRETAPLLVLFAIDEARVLVDRDDVWPLLCAQRARFERRAAAQLDVDRRAAAASFERLLSEPPAE
jgi:predicted nucleotidyltransferase